MHSVGSMVASPRLFSFAICAIVAWSGPASAAIIFSDTFSNNGDLNGSAPTIRPGTETWTSTSTVAGGSANVGAITSSYLAWTPQQNQIYRLSVDVTSSGVSTTASTYAGFGFFGSSVTTGGTYATTSANTPWAFLRTGNTTTTAIGDTAFRPLGATTSDRDTNHTVTNTVALALVLNTNDTSATAGTQWSLSFYSNGVQRGPTYTYTDAESTALLAAITSIGLTGATTGNSVSYDNFVLETIPEPSSLMLSASALGLLAIRRRR